MKQMVIEELNIEQAGQKGGPGPVNQSNTTQRRLYICWCAEATVFFLKDGQEQQANETGPSRFTTS